MARSLVVWTVPARQDLRNALECLVREAQAPAAASRLLNELETAAASLDEFPNRGRVVPELGPPRRELVVGSYRMVYRVGEDFDRTWRKGSGR